MTLKEQAHTAMDKWAREAPIDLKEVDVLAMYDYILYLEAGGDRVLREQRLVDKVKGRNKHARELLR